MVVIEIERGTKIYFTSSNNAILAQTCLHFLNKESEQNIYREYTFYK